MPYGLEKVTNPKCPIYQQTLNFFNFSQQVRGFSQKTMNAKVSSIKDFIKFTKIQQIEDITNQQIFDWIDWHKSRGNSGRTINNYIYQLQTMLKWQKDENISMPGLKLSRIVLQKEEPARKNWYTRQQIQTAMLYADQRTKLMIMISFECGLRIEEMVNLKVSDIRGRKIKIVGKGRKLRWVMISRKTKRLLNRWIRKQNSRVYIWRSPNIQGHICQEEARKAMTGAFRLAGFDDFRPHDLRHSFATELKLLGMPTRKIQLALGHSTEAITEHYLSDLDGITVEDIHREVRFALMRARIKAGLANILYILPRITIKTSK